MIGIKVGYQTYRLQKVDNEVVSNNVNCFGDIDYENQLIRISTMYSKERQLATLIHEAIHALDYLFVINLQEEQVQKLGTALAGLFIDNPKFLKIPWTEEE